MSADKSKKPEDLRVGKSEAGHVVVDNRGRNVWKWKDAEVMNAGSTTLLQKLANGVLGIADTQMWRKEDCQPVKSANKPRDLSLDDGDESAASNKSRLRPGSLRKKDAGGGFNPYG